MCLLGLCGWYMFTHVLLGYSTRYDCPSACGVTLKDMGSSHLCLTTTLRTKDRQFDNFVVTGGIVSCCYDNLRCHQSWQSCQIDDLLFSVKKTKQSANHLHNSWDVLCITQLPLDKMAAILQTIFSDAFSWMKIFVFWLKFHWNLFLRVQLTIFQHWFR